MTKLQTTSLVMVVVMAMGVEVENNLVAVEEILLRMVSRPITCLERYTEPRK